MGISIFSIILIVLIGIVKSDEIYLTDTLDEEHESWNEIEQAEENENELPGNKKDFIGKANLLRYVFQFTRNINVLWIFLGNNLRI